MATQFRRPYVGGMHTRVALAVLSLCGCTVFLKPKGPLAVAPKVEPIAVTTTYIAAYARRFARGQFAFVEVCVSADGTIAATRITRTSTDSSFDAAALNWARQARYQPQLENGVAVAACREVRVEINRNPIPRVMGGADSALG